MVGKIRLLHLNKKVHIFLPWSSVSHSLVPAHLPALTTTSLHLVFLLLRILAISEVGLVYLLPSLCSYCSFQLDFIHNIYLPLRRLSATYLELGVC